MVLLSTVRLVPLLAFRAALRLPPLARPVQLPLAILLGGGSVVPGGPSGAGVPGQSAVNTITSGVTWFAVALSLIGLLVGAAGWAIGSHSSNYQYTSAGKRAVLVSGLAALLIGAAPTLVGWFFATGSHVTK